MRPFAPHPFAIIIAAALMASPAIAGDGKSGHEGHKMDHGAHGGHAAMADGVHAKAEIHSIEGDTVNLTHEPIPAIGWPTMTMDLKLLEGAETGGAKPGDKVVIMLQKGPDGLYGLTAIEKAE